jgi:hypothetical protein
VCLLKTTAMPASGKKLPNSKQRIVRWLGLSILLVMAVLPPWKVSFSAAGNPQSASVGYHPIWQPPAEERDVPEDASDLKYQIDLKRLSIQLVAVLCAINVAHYFLRSEK